MVKSKCHAIRGKLVEVGDHDGQPTVSLQIGCEFHPLRIPVTIDEARAWGAHLFADVEINVSFEVAG